ncbi:hypothetical protein SS50377_20320 [Spironucleus salmonicida]|uniref:Uncharacterized protein n=1 Tax=Spironucleus salmonicida TaxID=348837 RepID=V6LES8_9EUKA|nr:hypothetical protein SS50377_20320 [Spironucleus salmonicida]|eukprot:EST43002.1 Hypothetical protein SS50377_17303 [Spironucleus salmonicida]
MNSKNSFNVTPCQEILLPSIGLTTLYCQNPQGSHKIFIIQDLLLECSFYFPLFNYLSKKKDNTVIMIKISHLKIFSPLSLLVAYSELIKQLKIRSKITFIAHGLGSVVPISLFNNQLYKDFVGKSYLIQPILTDFKPFEQKRNLSFRQNYYQQFSLEFEKRYYNQTSDIVLKYLQSLQKPPIRQQISINKNIQQFQRVKPALLYEKETTTIQLNNVNSLQPDLLQLTEQTPFLSLDSGFVFTIKFSKNIAEIINFERVKSISILNKMNSQLQKSLEKQSSCYMVKWKQNIQIEEINNVGTLQKFIPKFLTFNKELDDNSVVTVETNFQESFEIEVAFSQQ